MRWPLVNIGQWAASCGAAASAFLYLAMMSHAAPISIPEHPVFESVEIQIRNYTFDNISRIAICESEPTAQCDAAVRMLSDSILLLRGGTVVFSSDRGSDSGFVSISNATIFRTEADGPIPDIVVPARDGTGIAQNVRIVVQSDATNASEHH